MIFIHGGIYKFCEAGARADIQIKSCQSGPSVLPNFIRQYSSP